MSTKKIHRQVATIQTSEATAATLTGFTLPAGSVAFFKAKVLAIDSSAGTSSAWEVGGAIKQVAGTAIVVGSILNLIAAQQDVLAATWTATLDVNGADLRVRVTGQAATTIDWMTELEVWVLVP